MSNIKFHPKQIELLKTTFPPHVIEPHTDPNEIFFRAGQASVIRFMESRSNVDVGLHTAVRVSKQETS